MENTPLEVIKALLGPSPDNRSKAYEAAAYVVTHTRTYPADGIQATLTAALSSSWLTAKQKRSLGRLAAAAAAAERLEGEGEGEGEEDGCPDCFTQEEWDDHRED